MDELPTSGEPAAESAPAGLQDQATEYRNYLGGVARRGGIRESAIGRFIDTVRHFRLDAEAFLHELRRRALRDVDLFGISRIDQPPRPRSELATDPDRPLEEQWHGWTRAWTVRLYVHSEDPVSATFSDGEEGPEHSLATAMRFRDEKLRTPHTPRGPYTARKKRPGSSAPAGA